MTVFQSFVLGLLQGIAEFLPISSSGHLVIAQKLFNLDEVPLLFDIFLHLGTLFAVVLFFWKKIWALLKVLWRWISRKPAPETTEENLLYRTDKAGRNTIIAVLITTVITGIIGIVTSKLISDNLPIAFVFAGFIVTSILLVVSDIIEKHNATKENSSEGISILQAIVIGFLQGLGTLPGISRSGSTVAGALFSKVDRKVAGEYSFLVSIPAILGAFVLELKDLDQITEKIGVLPLVVGCLTAAIVGYGALWIFMKLFKKGKLQLFALYLIPVAILGFIFVR